MNTFQKNVVFLAIVVFVLCGTLMVGYYVYQSHKRTDAEQRAAWMKQNIRELKDLNQIGVLSTEEQTRLDNAGDDVEKLQQVLLDLHTERHTLWIGHMQDIEEREQALRRVYNYGSYDFNGQYRDAAVELAKDRKLAQENIDAYQRGYLNIRAWRPTSFEQFQAGTPRDLSHPGILEEGQQGKFSAIASTPTDRADTDPQLAPVVASQPISAPTQTMPSSAQNALDNVDVEVSQALRVWTQAMLSNDPEQIANCYAAHVDRYFLKLDLDNAAVKGYMSEWGHGGTKRITGFSTKDTTFENETSTTAKIRLVKDMTITDSSGTSEHLIRSRLYLRRDNGQWKITSEQDFK
jgi:hypothetical protein